MKIKFTEKPCQDAIDWLESQPDLPTAWKTCERGNWMWWALQHYSGWLPEADVAVAFAIWCKTRAKKHAATAAHAAHAAAAARTAAHAAAAARTAAHAATAARTAAAHAAHAAAAHAAGYAAELKAQARWIRKHVPCPELAV